MCNVPLVELIYLVFTRMPGESYCRRLRSLVLCLGDVFQALINFHACDFPSVCICVCLCMCVHVFVCTKFGSERVFLSDWGFLVPAMTVVSGW